MTEKTIPGRLGLGIAAALAAWMAAAPGAEAAPQIVAAVPTNGVLELSCDGGECAAEISTVCLQRGRAAPLPGDRYVVHAPDRAAIAVTGTAAGGGTVALDSGLLDFAALRGQVAFRVSLRTRDLARLGLAAVSIRVERMAMLVPVTDAEDGKPQTAADVRRAAGGMAATGGYWLALNDERMAVARVANRMVNDLPRKGSVAPDDSRALWARALAPESALAGPAAGDAVARARYTVEYCRAAAFEPGQFPMRRCLSRFHDRLLQDLNRGYWDALKPQS